MPPELPHYRSLTTPLIRFSPPSSPEAETPSDRKSSRETKNMKIPGRKIIPLVVFLLAIVSTLRLVRIAITTSSSAPTLPALPPTLQQTCSPHSSACNRTSLQAPSSTPTPHNKFSNATILTKKEFKLLTTVIKHRAPCNLLVFGLEPQYLKLSSINAGGITIFLEDDPEKIRSVRGKSNHTRIYKVEYQTPAKKAYKLLKHARRSPACLPSSLMAQNSTCKLALTNLPQEVYAIKWDVIVVDGPSGHSPEAPGRMAAIYTAGVIARAGNITDVVVHDVDRTIERWFSWEFLCDENLVSSKGRFWNFRIKGKSNSTRFCSDEIVPII